MNENCFYDDFRHAAKFYRWSNIARASLFHGSLKHQAKHFFYAAGWKKFEPVWDWLIRARRLAWMTPMLEAVLSKVSRSRVEQARGVSAVDAAM